jgi:hypothetical protein
VQLTTIKVGYPELQTLGYLPVQACGADPRRDSTQVNHYVLHRAETGMLRNQIHLDAYRVEVKNLQVVLVLIPICAT